MLRKRFLERIWIVVVLSTAMSTQLGCNSSSDEIVTYRLAKQQQTETNTPSHPSASSAQAETSDATVTDRMLAAIITHGDRAWSFKMVGPVADVSRFADGFRSIVQSVKFEGHADGQWDLPAGWRQLPASGMRLATLVPDPSLKSIDCSVIVLPPQDTLLNVNRWRGQLQLPPLEPDDLDAEIERLQTPEGVEVVLVDLKGRMVPGGMMSPPFANVPPAQSGRPESAGVEPSAITSSDAEAVVFEAPGHWERQPNRLSQLHVFSVRDGEKNVEISISRLPKAGGELLPNVNRWRSQLELPPWDNQELRTAIRERPIGNETAQSVELRSADTTAAPRAILGSIVVRGDQAWFFKISGDVELVDREREPFEAFLDSVRFP